MKTSYTCSDGCSRIHYSNECLLWCQFNRSTLGPSQNQTLGDSLRNQIQLRPWWATGWPFSSWLLELSDRHEMAVPKTKKKSIGLSARDFKLNLLQQAMKILDTYMSDMKKIIKQNFLYLVAKFWPICWHAEVGSQNCSTQKIFMLRLSATNTS